MKRPTVGDCVIHALQDAGVVVVFALLGRMMFSVASALGAPNAVALVFGLGWFGVGGAYFQLAAAWWWKVLRSENLSVERSSD